MCGPGRVDLLRKMKISRLSPILFSKGTVRPWIDPLMQKRASFTSCGFQLKIKMRILHVLILRHFSTDAWLLKNKVGESVYITHKSQITDDRKKTAHK